MKIKYLVIIFTVYTLTSCHFFGQDARMTLAWYNREMILPSGLPCKMMGKEKYNSMLENGYNQNFFNI